MLDWPGSARNVRRRLFLGIAGVVLALLQVPAPPIAAADLEITLTPASENSLQPQMGDRLGFHSVIRNTGGAPMAGIVAWLSLIQTDAGNEQPVDLEDWSAHRAVAAASLAPGQSIETDWPLRLIDAGTYRVFVCAMTRDGSALVVSPVAKIGVREKPVVESGRVLAVALGLPALIGAALFWRWRRG
jgi:hypothetical protein